LLPWQYYVTVPYCSLKKIFFYIFSVIYPDETVRCLFSLCPCICYIYLLGSNGGILYDYFKLNCIPFLLYVMFFRTVVQSFVCQKCMLRRVSRWLFDRKSSTFVLDTFRYVYVTHLKMSLKMLHRRI